MSQTTKKQLSVTEIARIVHEANRAYCLALGDTSQPRWEDAPAWQTTSAVEGVANILLGRVRSPEQSHESWLAHKVADGWVYGTDKDPDKKTHPCMVDYADLPADQKRKDAIYFAIVKACR